MSEYLLDDRETDELTDYHAAMKRAEASDGVLFSAPTVQAIVGRKP